MKIVTAGSGYLDIDSYGGCIAYAELLQLQGQPAAFVSTATINESVSATVRSWGAPLLTQLPSDGPHDYILVDVSNPEFFDRVVDHDRVEEVIDHHVGHEELWQQRLGDKARIEFIGAACTLVYESWVTAGLLSKMSPLSARVLICGILDNTLNFGAQVTTQRDTDAYAALLPIANLPADWTAQYFAECQTSILADIDHALRNDTKTPHFKTLGREACMGQLTVWDAPEVLAQHEATIATTLQSMHEDWFLNLISIGERKSYFVTDRPEIQLWLSSLLDVTFDGSVGIAERTWLRKEVIKRDLRG